MMPATGTLLCMMSAIIAMVFVIFCDSVGIKTGAPYYMNYFTYPTSASHLTGTPYIFGSYYPLPTPQNYCIREGKRYSVGEFIHARPCTYCSCEEGGHFSCQDYECMMQYPWCDDFYREHPDDCCVKCPRGYNCTAPDGEFVQYKELYYMNKKEVCHCLGREPNETAVCEPVKPSTKHSPVIG